MGAIRTKLESYKKPAQGKVLRGGGKNQKAPLPKFTGGGRGNMLSMIRMAMAMQRRGQAAQNAMVTGEVMANTRQGTVDRDALMLHQIDASMADVDQLLQSLGVD